MDEPKPVKDNVVELRRHPRFRMAPPVVLPFVRAGISFMFRGDHCGEGTVADLSAKGCKVVSRAPVRVGDRLSLTISVPNQGTPFCVDAASVRWITSGSFGVEWKTLPPDDERRLKILIRSEG